MESGTNNKRLKVVWLCHFSNREIKEYLKTPEVQEFAPWITLMAELFETERDVEVHIVSPHEYISGCKYFEIRGIHYHFFNAHIPFWGRHWPDKFKFDLWSNYFFNKRKIAKIINKINPDIIHLHGAENAYYSAGILPLLDKYPTLTTIQGFIRNASDTKSLIVKKAIETEDIILKKSKHIGVRTDEMSETATRINPGARLHYHNYPARTPAIIKNNIGKEEPIDCLFFARVCKDKGIEDLITAISIIKKSYPEISLSVIGGTGMSYISYLKSMCAELNIENNVRFLGFLPTQEDVYKYALQSKMCVSPTYHEIISGTIIESMFMKLPVVAYAVGGIPELNTKEDTVMLVEKHNINQLAEKILLLVNRADLRETLAEKAFAYAYKRFDNNNIASEVHNIYKTIINENSI